MRFIDIPAHEVTKQRLRNFVSSGKIPHAILLEGPSGIGKFAMARAFAQYVHCENRQDGDSCGICPSCIQHQTFNHIDTHFAFPVLKKSSKKAISDDYIEEWREFLNDNPYMDIEKWPTMLGKSNGQPVIYVDESQELIRKLNYTSHKSKYKIVLLWLPERMNEACANKMLKLLEEPHDDTLFVLTSNEPKEVLPTIYSRMQRIEMKRLPDDVIAKILIDKYSISEQDAIALAHNADGCMLSAEKSISIKSEDKQFLEFFIQLMRLAYQRKVKDLKTWSIDVADLGREQTMRFLSYSQRLLRENFIYNLNISQLNYMNHEESQFSHNFARFITERNVEKLMQVLNNALVEIAGNANAKIVMFDVAIKVILLLKL